MAKIYVFLADGFEEIEGLTVVDILRRGEVETVTVSVTGNRLVQGSHGIPVTADCLFEDQDLGDGTVYVLADSGGPWPETCPAGLVQAGEAELPDTGERCPCFAPPEDTGEIWVYQTCRDPETGTAYMGYVRYVAETPDR